MSLCNDIRSLRYKELILARKVIISFIVRADMERKSIKVIRVCIIFPEIDGACASL